MAETEASSSSNAIEITLSFKGQVHTLSFPAESTVEDLKSTVDSTFSIPPEYQKILAPKTGVLKDTSLPLSGLVGKKLTLMGASPDKVAAANKAAAQANRPRVDNSRFRTKPRVHHDWKKEQEESQYTFLQLRPLAHLPHPERSEALLARLRDDPGIKAVMRKYKWTVPLLTEMDPAAHTTHDGKTLGLNRNKGEVIELRLRTDDYGGYRDYKTIRRTLVHELAHNVYSDHDRNFYDLMNQLEKEVQRADWHHGGRTLTEEVFYDPREAELERGGHVDGGGWTGGSYVLGGRPAGSAGLTQREILARAAEERIKRQREVEEKERRERQGQGSSS